MEDKELYNPQTGEKIAPKRPKKFYKDWRFYVYSLIALMLAIVSISSALTACAAINAGVGKNEQVSYSVAQRKNAAITTDEGGYNGYRFTVSPTWLSELNTANADIYDVDVSTYTLTFVAANQYTVSGYSNGHITQIGSVVSAARSSTLRFLVYSSYGRPWANATCYYLYFSFIMPTGTNLGSQNTAFKCLTGLGAFRGLSTQTTGWAFNVAGSPYYQIPTDNSDVLLMNTAAASVSDLPTDWVFQDVVSYYQELGYQGGYSEGYSEGNADGYAAGESAGYASGYLEGLEVGNSNGEANGYANGYAAGLNASNYFKSITANNDLVLFDILANITPYYTDGNGNLYYYRIFSAEVGEDFYYCWLCYYSTSNWTQWDVYLVWCDQSSSSGFTLDYLENHSLGVWGVPKSNGAFSSVQSYAVYNPSIQTLDNAKVSLVYNVQMMQAYVTLDGGCTYGDVYHDGYTTGYQNGYNYGYELGETAGINAAEPEALTNTLVAVFQQPFNQIYRFFNFNILGLNILGLVTGLVSVFIILKVFRKFLK